MNEEDLCCYIDDAGRQCDAKADFRIYEDRSDLHPADNFTDSCENHVGLMLATRKENNAPWRWIVEQLK